MTKIEWAEKTWNPITGCSKISEGCKNCYAERMSKRLAGRYGYPKDNPFAVTLHQDKMLNPLKWKKPTMVFVCSMGDLLHNKVKQEWQEQVFTVMKECPQHTFLILTKRPNNFIKDINKTPKNLWIGVTVENQFEAEKRIPLLLSTPAVKRFISVEPMLEQIKIKEVSKLDWVICGGETGQNARPMKADWARNLKAQCKNAGVPFFFKKIGQGKEIPEDLLVREYPDD